MLPLVARRDLSKLRCWNKWCLASDDLLLKKIFVGRHAEVLVGGASLSNLNTMLPILTKFGFLAQWVGCNSNLDDGYDWMEKCRSVCLQLYRHKEKVEMVSRPTLSFYHSLDLYRPGLSTFLMDTSNPQGVRLKVMARIGHLPLLAKLCRFLNLSPRACVGFVVVVWKIYTIS